MIVKSPLFVDNPLVSVFILTYNQEETIAQTIEGVLAQISYFAYEIIIGDDCSRDKTRHICEEYQQKFPKTIKLLLQDTNQGLVKNYIDGMRLCRGKFIAQCAGDDYWIDNWKLAKQVNFLENNPDYGVVSTNGYRLIVRTNKLLEGIPPLKPVPDGNVFSLAHKEGVYAMPLSLMFRRDLLKHIDFDQFIKRKFSCEDVPVQTIMARHTKFGHLSDHTCVYRVYNESMTYTAVHHSRFLDYHTGLVSMKRYLAELYPGETSFTEEWANDYMAYKRVILAFYNFDYREAKNHLSGLIHVGSHEKRVLMITSNRLFFYIACVAKRVKYFYRNKIIRVFEKDG